MVDYDNSIRPSLAARRAVGGGFGEGDRIRHLGLNLTGWVRGTRDGLIVIALASRRDPATPIDQISVDPADIEHID